MEMAEALVGRVVVGMAAVVDRLAGRAVNTCRSSEGCPLWRTLEGLADVEAEDSGDQKAVVVGASGIQTLGAVVQT